MFSSGQHDRSFYKELWESLNKKGYWEGEIYNRHKNGSIYVEWIRISAIKNDEGHVNNYIALVSDITHKKSTEEQLLKHAHHDPLTGAHNRLSFSERFKHDLLLAKRNNYVMAILYLDLDKFKPINDTYGHQTGDKILKQVTTRITNNIRATDTLARLGGDEFIILLPQLEQESDAQKVANSLREIIRTHYTIDKKELYLDVSIGIAVYPRDGQEESKLIEIADRSMYENKQRS